MDARLAAPSGGALDLGAEAPDGTPEDVLLVPGHDLREVALDEHELDLEVVRVGTAPDRRHEALGVLEEPGHVLRPDAERDVVPDLADVRIVQPDPEHRPLEGLEDVRPRATAPGVLEGREQERVALPSGLAHLAGPLQLLAELVEGGGRHVRAGIPIAPLEEVQVGAARLAAVVPEARIAIRTAEIDLGRESLQVTFFGSGF